MKEKKINFIQIIKDFFQRKNQKRLPEGKEQKTNFTERLKDGVTNVRTPQNRTIDYAIEQFLIAYIINSEKGKPSAYSSVVNLGGKIENEPSHRAEEVSLLNVLRKSNNFRIDKQRHGNFMNGNDIEAPNAPGDTSFYHIRTKAGESINDNVRLYLNPNRKNLLDMVGELTQRCQNIPLFFKFQSDKLLTELAEKHDGRSEKIVIYCDSNVGGNLTQVINVLEQMKKEKPYLFEGCENNNPFLKSIDGIICYANNPHSSEYHDLDGQIVTIAPSYNSFLSKALEESTDGALMGISKMTNDTQLMTLSKTEKLKKLLSDNSSMLIAQIKHYLAICQQNNDVLDIKGIEDKSDKYR